MSHFCFLLKPLLHFRTSRMLFLSSRGAALSKRLHLNYIIISCIQATVIPLLLMWEKYQEEEYQKNNKTNIWINFIRVWFLVFFSPQEQKLCDIDFGPEEKATSRTTAKYLLWMSISACYNHRESKGCSQGSISAVFWAIKYSKQKSQNSMLAKCCVLLLD